MISVFCEDRTQPPDPVQPVRGAAVVVLAEAEVKARARARKKLCVGSLFLGLARKGGSASGLMMPRAILLLPEVGHRLRAVAKAAARAKERERGVPLPPADRRKPVRAGSSRQKSVRTVQQTAGGLTDGPRRKSLPLVRRSGPVRRLLVQPGVSLSVLNGGRRRHVREEISAVLSTRVSVERHRLPHPDDPESAGRGLRVLRLLRRPRPRLDGLPVLVQPARARLSVWRWLP